MNHCDLFPVVIAQELLHQHVDDAEIVRRLRAAFHGLSRVDAVSAVAAARVLERHGRDLTDDT